MNPQAKSAAVKSLKKSTAWSLAFAVGCIWLAAAGPIQASLVMSSGLGTTQAGNLVTNGSFENGAPANGAANNLYWITGTTNTPAGVPAGWTTLGAPGALARWGNDSGAPYRLASSDVLPDGRAAVFFNNGTGFVNQAPTMQPNGQITFASTPTFTSTNGAPAIIGQTVMTNLFVQPSYNLSFWVSGEENATVQGNTGLSIMGFRMTNVLAGNPTLYLTVPNSIILGQSHLYEFTFTPLNPSLPVSIQFMTWGHMDLSAWGGTPFGTEAILDDVIINGVPEPGTFALLAGGLVLLAGARRVQRRGARA